MNKIVNFCIIMTLGFVLLTACENKKETETVETEIKIQRKLDPTKAEEVSVIR